MTGADKSLVGLLAELLLEGPDLDGAEPSGEWAVTVALGHARRIVAAGWRPTNVPPALTPTPPAPAGGTQAQEVPNGDASHA